MNYHRRGEWSLNTRISHTVDSPVDVMLEDIRVENDSGGEMQPPRSMYL
jgi:hypothetical protein